MLMPVSMEMYEIWNGMMVANDLTHLFPMHPFSTPWKHQKADIFSQVEKGCIGSEWVNIENIYYSSSFIQFKN